MTLETRFGFPIEVWEAVVAEAQQILVTCAKNRETITYSGLSRRIETAHIPYHSFKMVGLLDEIDSGEFAKETSSLATLVVRKADGLPGGGYFSNKFPESTPVEDLRAFWESEFEQTCTDWQD